MKLVQDLGTGTMGQISWQRLTQLFRNAGEITQDEKIVGFQADSQFLRYKVERVNRYEG